MLPTLGKRVRQITTSHSFLDKFTWSYRAVLLHELRANITVQLDGVEKTSELPIFAEDHVPKRNTPHRKRNQSTFPRYKLTQQTEEVASWNSRRTGADFQPRLVRSNNHVSEDLEISG
ncbi:hypothetical protein RB195_010918 [Necator americanus]|uniref:Uncharacterized protein n=1 Tax=Necator americanus TaxID=51031 RepID=A0ABR1D193_NECAM